MLFFYKIILFVFSGHIMIHGYKNIEITNIDKKNIFDIKKNSYLVKKINIEVVNGSKNEKFLIDNIYSILTIYENEYINLKNSSIATNIARIKKIFKSIKNVTFEGSLDGSNGLIINIKVEKFEKIKNINITGLKIDKKKVDKINDDYKDKLFTNAILEDIKEKLEKTFDTDILLKIITYEKEEHTYFIKNKNKQKKYYVRDVKIVGNKSINEIDIIKNLTIKGSKYYSFGNNLFSLIKNSKINNFNLFKTLEVLKSKFFVWDNIFFDKEALKNDKKKIIDIYLSKGFLDIKIDKIDINLDKGNTNFDIKYYINEGKQYVVGDVEFIGNNNVKTEILKQIINIKKGAPLNYIYLKNSASGTGDFGIENNLKNYYNTIGYLKSNIKFKIKSINKNVVNIVFCIEEGEKVIINKIKVSGNRYVDSTEFYKSSFLFPGDTYDHNKYIATQQNILRNNFLNPKKSFVTLDNDNNLQMVIDEKIGIEPILNISTQQIKENSCCKCCECCKIGPAINIGCVLTNLNFKKLLHLKDNRYSFLGAGDTVKVQFTYSPLDAKLNVELSGTIRKISRGIGAGIAFQYSRYKGDIDNKNNDFDKDKNKDKEDKNNGCCSSLVHDISFASTIIFSNFTNTFRNILKPIHLNAKIGRNTLKVYKYYLDINIHNELKYSTLADSFWENNGLEASFSLIITNPFLFLAKESDKKILEINKYCGIFTYLTFYKELYKKLVFNIAIDLGYNKSLNKYKNSFKIDKEDISHSSSINNKNIAYIYLNGINESSTLLNIINKCRCNLGFKLNIELRYLFINSSIVNTYLFCFFNGGNLFLAENKTKYNELKQYSKANIFNPIRFYSVGFGIRFEPEILKFILPNLHFSLYYDLRNRNLSFNIIRK